MTTAPVIFTIFNRPDTTRQVFEKIRAAKPQKLLVVADGPRVTGLGEAEKCIATREIIDEVDWDLRSREEFSETNLGCRVRCASGITWAFTLVDKAIILEDDTLPSTSFFPYCTELLDRYEGDERVTMISGNNFLFGNAATTDSYYFSRYPHVGDGPLGGVLWAKYDLDMTRWPEMRAQKAVRPIPADGQRTLFLGFDTSVCVRGQHRYLGLPVRLGSMWANSGLSIAPSRNLVRNIGFSHADATHTTAESVYSSLQAEELSLPRSSFDGFGQLGHR